MIDEGSAVAFIETVDVAIVAELHDRAGTVGRAFGSLGIGAARALVFDDLYTPRDCFTANMSSPWMRDFFTTKGYFAVLILIDRLAYRKSRVAGHMKLR